MVFIGGLYFIKYRIYIGERLGSGQSWKNFLMVVVILLYVKENK